MNNRGLDEDEDLEQKDPALEQEDLAQQSEDASKQADDNAAKEAIKKAAAKKAKQVMIRVGLSILSAIAPFLVIFLIIIAVIAAAWAIIALIMSMIDAIYVGTDKIYNLFEYGSFKDSEGVFIERLKKEYETYRRMPNVEGELDLALIMSTVNYGRIFETDDFGNSDQTEDANEIADASEYYQVVSSKDTKAFYKVMNDQLGVPYSLYPPDKLLLGHLIDIKITGVCIPKPENLSTLVNLGGEVVDSAYEIAKVFATMFGDTAFDPASSIGFFNALRTLTGIKPFLIANEIWAYGEATSDGSIVDTALAGLEQKLTSELDGYLSGWSNHNPISTLARIAKNSEKPDCGENEIAIPKITYFQNYELYREYLIKYMDISFVHRMYINCPKCQYKDSPDSTKRIIAERMVDEIFEYKKSYDSIVASTTGVGAAVYIPGASSFPFDIGDSGERVLEHVSNPGGLVTSKYGEQRVVWNSAGTEIISQGTHSGVDFGIVQGTPLYSLADGEVVRSREAGSYGNFVKIKHDLDGQVFFSLYAHMSELGVSEGDFVGGGQPIGLSGGAEGSFGAGTSNGPHLHFEIQDSTGQHVNPMEYLRGAIQGSGIFEASQTYLAMKDYDLPYCDADTSSKYSGSMPISLSIIGRKLGLETDPATVISQICSNYSADKYSFLTSDELKTNFKIVGTKLTSPTLDAIDESLTNKKPVLISIKGGAFNMIGDGGNIVIIQKNDKYLVLSTFNEAKNGMYSKEDIETMIIPQIDQGVWSFEGVE